MIKFKLPVLTFALPSFGTNHRATGQDTANINGNDIHAQADVRDFHAVRCWNCGEYTEDYAEQCEHCGHSPSPFADSFPRDFSRN